ncbi:ABC transporter substrate-binding protein [Elioraea sp.]|uniref:ABC transporter substrate-binding protein n=1 Tax=Elioraea sp. TaxID=2185103 RepID=UPI0021DE0741|nr:ABC transporter substrate-binding protein [Elioraea sp.]GIX10087.1 MAG: peptide ABC transporter substrate-binding protein [Elioraea sp.]
MRRTMRGIVMAAAGAIALVATGEAFAQAPRNTLVVLREIDADRYDPHKVTAFAAGEVIYMMTDTLVSMDWDQTTIRPGLAKSWTVSEDGRLYTFNLRDDVTFCDGRRMTAHDVVYSLNRWIDPATRSPVRWRAGPVKEIRAKDDVTVEYELNEPFAELLFQLTLYFAGVIDRNAVERLGDNFGTQGFNGTGPYCWVSWTPRQDLVLQKHPTYNWGPPIYQNPSPQIERVIWRVIPDPNTRIAALQTGQGDATQYIPTFALEALKRVPGMTVQRQPNYFVDFFMGFKVDKPVVNDPVIRRAVNLAVDRDAMVQATFFGAADPMRSLIHPAAPGFDPEAKAKHPGHDPAEARRILDEAGWRPGPDGIRVKDGQRASFLVYAIATQTNRQMTESMQADLRRVGIEMRIQMFDATVAWGRLATQEFDAFMMSYPYVSATDALNLYFRSEAAPTPNRMNWKNEQTDAWLREARSALDEAVRRQAVANVQRQLTDASVWFPIAHSQLWLATGPRVAGARPHGVYSAALYKGLDIRLTR